MFKALTDRGDLEQFINESGEKINVLAFEEHPEVQQIVADLKAEAMVLASQYAELEGKVNRSKAEGWKKIRAYIVDNKLAEGKNLNQMGLSDTHVYRVKSSLLDALAKVSEKMNDEKKKNDELKGTF